VRILHKLHDTHVIPVCCPRWAGGCGARIIEGAIETCTGLHFYFEGLRERWLKRPCFLCFLLPILYIATQAWDSSRPEPILDWAGILVDIEIMCEILNCGQLRCWFIYFTFVHPVLGLSLSSLLTSLQMLPELDSMRTWTQSFYASGIGHYFILFHYYLSQGPSSDFQPLTYRILQISQQDSAARDARVGCKKNWIRTGK